jgi:hypothetical protein
MISDSRISRMAPRKSHADANEGEILASTGVPHSPKYERFRRLAENRTNRALEAIALLGNLSNRHIYEYDEADVRKITKVLRDAVNVIEDRLSAPKARAGARFKL